VVQTNNLASGATELVSALSQVMQELRNRLGPNASDLGRGAILFKLDRLGATRPSDLAGRCHLDVSTVSRHLAALEREGLVARLADPDDGRSHRVDVTESGRVVVGDYVVTRDLMLQAATADWTDTERQDLERLLRRLAADLAANSGEPGGSQ